jgi:hypothetical protein
MMWKENISTYKSDLSVADVRTYCVGDGSRECQHHVEDCSDIYQHSQCARLWVENISTHYAVELRKWISSSLNVEGGWRQVMTVLTLYT